MIERPPPDVVYFAGPPETYLFKDAVGNSFVLIGFAARADRRQFWYSLDEYIAGPHLTDPPELDEFHEIDRLTVLTKGLDKVPIMESFYDGQRVVKNVEV